MSERRRVEEALRASEEHTRAVLDAARDGIVSADETGRIRSANVALCRVLGYAQDELLGRDAAELFGWPGEGGRPDLAGLAGSSCELVANHRDGSRVPVQVSVARTRLGDGWTLVATIRDLRGQKALESQVRAAAAAAALAEDRERRRLAGDLHDEVSQLLTLAAMKFGMLRGSAAAAGLEEPLREVAELVARARQRTESLSFQLSPPILHDVGLAAAAEWLAEEMRRSYGLKVQVAREEEPPLDEAGRVTLFRALRELLINVARHAGTDVARVAFARAGDTLVVSVEDDGVGFDPQRVKDDGFGLLSLRERLEALGGRLEFDATKQPGTRARLLLPLGTGAT